MTGTASELYDYNEIECSEPDCFDQFSLWLFDSINAEQPLIADSSECVPVFDSAGLSSLPYDGD